MHKGTWFTTTEQCLLVDRQCCSPSVTECYFLLSPFIRFFSCDNLEMSLKSNIFISCVAI